jgi:hypothetical protein
VIRPAGAASINSTGSPTLATPTLRFSTAQAAAGARPAIAFAGSTLGVAPGAGTGTLDQTWTFHGFTP